MSSSARRLLLAGSIALLGTGLCVLLSRLYFDLSYFEPDTASYLFQAKLFAKGKICEKAPPDYGLSPSPHINILNGKWYSKYPFGNALMLTPGVLLNAPWLMPALATGGSLLLLYLIVEEVYGPAIGLIAEILGLISPLTLGLGATWFSEPVSRLFLALFLFGLIKTLRGRGGAIHPILSGFALGYAFNTRPFPAVAFGICGAALLLCSLIRLRKPRLLGSIALFIPPFSAMIGLTLAWNWYLTGDPLKPTHNAAQPYDKPGFGRRCEGYDPDPQNAFLFTPRWALERIWRHTIPCVSFNALGWGYYRPDLFRSLRRYADSVVVGLVIKSPSDGDWVTLKLWGHGDGSGQVQFQRRGDETSPGLTGRAPGFEARGGRTRLWMRLIKEGDLFKGMFAPQGKGPIEVGPTRAKLSPPFEVGIYAGVCSLSGRMRVEFERFVVNRASEGDLVPDEFEGGPGPAWRWHREPRKWKISDGRLKLEAERRANLFVEDTASRLYQVSGSDLIDVETEFEADWSDNSLFPLLRAIPLGLPIALMLAPLIHRSRRGYDLFFLSLFLSTLALYSFFYFEGSTWGFTPVNARYYAEATLLGIIPLAARGIWLAAGSIRRIGGRLRKKAKAAGTALLALISLGLMANTVHTYISFAEPFRNWSDVYQKLPKLVRERKLQNAVIFIPHTRDAPLGDYPFKPLDEADIVYFKLGPSKVWRLMSSDWKEVYQRYFRGRRAFIYEGRELRELDVTSF